MAPTKIMIIRHAEKPPDGGGAPFGVTPGGDQDGEELVVRGWQRSGALVRFFAPAGGQFSQPALATPGVIFASAVAPHSKSLRPQHTVLALADFLGLQLDLTHPKGGEDDLVDDALTRDGTVLIAWEHVVIHNIANRIVGDATTCPQQWPGPRFDVVWVFDRAPGGGAWNFSQVPQMLLPGDQNTVIR
jgi:hypothetical protein